MNIHASDFIDCRKHSTIDTFLHLRGLHFIESEMSNLNLRQEQSAIRG